MLHIVRGPGLSRAITMAAANLPIELPEHIEAQRKTQCPNNVLLAIYGKAEDKRKAYDHSLTRSVASVHPLRVSHCFTETRRSIDGTCPDLTHQESDLYGVTNEEPGP